MSFLDGKIVPADVPEREPRERGLVRAQIRVDRIADQEIIVRNVSRRGLGGASRGAPLLVGEHATVLFADGHEMTGVIRWVNGLSFGMQLDHELDPQALARAVQRQKDLGSASTNWEVKRLHRVAPATANTDKLRRV